jgi:RNA polymerase sigma factor (sigma-70 family)
MAASLAQALRQVQRWTSSPRGDDASDALLLERYVRGRDESAFAALVTRYGAMVLRLCRRILGDTHEAEDAFQAVFLILARKAGSIRQPEALPGWLHGVARRVALKARTKSAGRACADLPSADALADPHPDPLAQLSARELLDLLEAEVRHLPAPQRSAVVLCCLEGLTLEDTARRLGATVGSLKGHLERGRRRLHARLARRGIALSAALALVAFSRSVAAPARLQQSAVRAAFGGADGSAAALAETILRGMYAAKLAGVAALVMTLALAASATVALSYHGAAAESDPEDKTPAAAKTAEKAASSARVDAQGDPLPEGAILRLGSIRYRTGAGINHAALSPDGKLLAAASEPGITLFDLATGKPRHLRESAVPNGFDTLGSKLAFSPDGKQLVSVTNGGNIRFWDVATGRLIRALGDGNDMPAIPRGGTAIGMPAALFGTSHFAKVWFPPESKSVVAGTHDNFAILIEPATGKVQRRFQVAGELSSVASDGRTLAVIDAKRPEVILYDDSGKELRRFRHESKVDPATLCQGGKRLVTINEKSEIKVWDTATGKEQRTFAGPAVKSQERTPSVVSIAPDGGTLFVGTQGGSILRWDLRTGEAHEPLRGHGNWVTGLFHAPDGRSLISVSWDNVIRRWNLTTGQAESIGDGFALLLRVARSPGGRKIAAASYPGRLEFWDAATGRRLHTYSFPAGYASRVRFSPDGKRLALACSDARVRVWDVDNERVTHELKLSAVRQPGDGGRSWFEGLAWSPDGRFLVTSMRGDGLRMWEAATGKEMWHEARQGAVAFSPDGKTLVSGGWDQGLTWQDAATGKLRFTRKDGSSFIDDIALSPDGSVMVTCHHGGNIYLRDPDTGQVRKTLQAHQGVAWSVSFSPDGNWLASCGCDSTVYVWEVATGQEVFSRNGHEGWVMQAEFGPDGRSVLSASHDLTALLWSLRPNSERGGKRPPEALWVDLAGEPAKAYRAIWELADDPRAAGDMLRRKIAPIKLHVDERRVKTLLADLDSDDFDKREVAGRGLAAMGEAAEGQLRRALSDAKSAEVQRRLRGLLNDLKREPTAEDFRRMRAVQVMELCGTPDAIGVLRDWAGGTASVPLTRQAKAALERLSNNRH